MTQRIRQLPDGGPITKAFGYRIGGSAPGQNSLNWFINTDGTSSFSGTPLVSIPNAIGDGVTSDTAAIVAANAAAAAIGGALYIPDTVLGYKIGTATITVPVMSDGGFFVLTTGQTTTFTGPISAPPIRIFSNALAGQGTVSFAGNKSMTRIYPQWWGATGDGTTDDRLTIQACLTAGGTVGSGVAANVHFPATANGYLVTGSVLVPSGMTVSGDGYGSMIKCPDAGWLLTGPSNYAIMTLMTTTNIRITGLRFYGTLNAPADAADAGFVQSARTPKHIWMNDATRVKVDHCWFDNTYWESTYTGGQGLTNRDWIYTDNHFYDCGYAQGAAACCLTFNAQDAVVSNNVFNKVGSAISVSGQRSTCTGNTVRDASGSGIAISDGQYNGLTTIVGNTVEVTESASGPIRAFVASGATVTAALMNFSNNSAHVIGGALGTAVGFYLETANFASFSGNTVEIDVRGIGFRILGTAVGNSVELIGNTVRVKGEVGASIAFSAAPNGAGKTLNIRSSNNRVYGTTRAQSSYAFNYDDASGGTLLGHCSNDFALEGLVKLQDISYAALATTDVTTAMPFSDNLSVELFSNFSRYQQIATLNVMPSANPIAVATGAIALTGVAGGTSFAKKQTHIKIDTEGAAATDDLDTITGGVSGDILIVSSVNNGRDTTLKNGTGNLFIGADFTLLTTMDRIVLMSDGTNWYQISRSTN